jgi:hypothetical protein
MFTTLNQRWVVHLQERERRALKNIATNPRPQNWLQALLHWCKQLIYFARQDRPAAGG